MLANWLPREVDPAGCRRSLVLFAIVCSRPGLDEVRDHLADASPGWLALATLLAGLSFASYVVMFGPVFCAGAGLAPELGDQ
jgi:hypothetical protein